MKRYIFSRKKFPVKARCKHIVYDEAYKLYESTRDADAAYKYLLKEYSKSRAQFELESIINSVDNQ